MEAIRETNTARAAEDASIAHAVLRREQRYSSASRLIVSAALVFAGYYFGAKIGFALTFRPHPVSVLWPPNSILLAALLLTPYRSLCGVRLAAPRAHWL